MLDPENGEAGYLTAAYCEERAELWVSCFSFQCRWTWFSKAERHFYTFLLWWSHHFSAMQGFLSISAQEFVLSANSLWNHC